MLTLLSILLLSSHVISLGQSLECNDKTQYKNKNGKCCEKCEPGQMMMDECKFDKGTVCNACSAGHFMDAYNNNYRSCHICKMCTREHMKIEKECTPTSDAVCSCNEGYSCSNIKCESCVKIPTPAAPAVSTKPERVTQDYVWICVSLCCVCVCVCVLFTCFLLTSRRAQSFGWIMSASPGFGSTTKINSRSSQCTEEEQVPMPVQEVCGTTEKLEDV